MNFGDMSFHGGIQNFGGQNTNTQNNYAAPGDQVRGLLTAIRDEHPDPSYADREIAAIRGEIADGTPEARGHVQSRLRQLAASAGSTRTVVEAAAAIGAIVAGHWPL
ncbi:hypothetical protein HH310_29425 [Actinoplanes sp. TBRC 11911]|uniref:hypothetical protein n=1 Tax=Actinoplanes sp. TBRC 11911 TaxID=2729386 RepID=UPI00145D95C6|nr:hypothetical protein [Actinoplanes sp. TBRC 11911]NMO55292.1 hypothetical protein [Actinoplanes sp. TBRC 11911]